MVETAPNYDESAAVINSGNHEHAGSQKKSGERGGGVEIPLMPTPHKESLANATR